MLPHAIVVNLDRDVERMAHMRRELTAAGLSFERFDAVRGARVPLELSAYFSGCRKLSPGEIGCYASHLQICRLVADGSLPSPLLVLEDDVAIEPNFAETIRALIEVLPERWDIVRLSQPTKRATMRVASLARGYELVRYSYVPTSTGGYLLSRAGALKFLAERPRELPVDQDLRRVWEWGLETYGVSPPPLINDCLGASTIDALSPGGRETWSRTAWMKAKRWIEMPRRHLHGMRDFGVLRWTALEAVNVVGRLAPRQRRRDLFAWANTALARNTT